MLNTQVMHSVYYEHDYLAAIGREVSHSQNLSSGRTIHLIAGSLFDELFTDFADIGHDLGLGKTLNTQIKSIETKNTETKSAKVQWLVRDWIGRQPVLKIQHYVGVVQSRNGHVLEILPKTGKHGQSASDLRLVLLRMLQALPDMPFKMLPQSALQQLAKMPLREVFVQQALRVWQGMFQRGLKQRYQSHEDNLPLLRGRLLIQQQLKHNHSHQARFYSEQDNHSRNCPENRIIRLALQYVLQLVGSAEQLDHVQRLIAQLSDVPASTAPAQDFKRIVLDRNSQHYSAGLQWARLIIDGFCPITGAGQQLAFSLLFDMNKLFEQFVAQQLSQQLLPNYSLSRQASTMALLQVGSQSHQRLRPDLMLYQGQQPYAILDSKWKIRQGQTFAELKPHDNDLYQMFAYAAAYLPQGGEVCLIYPKTPQFSRAVEPLAFTHIRDAKVNLWLLPFCLDSGQLMDAPFVMSKPYGLTQIA